MRTWVVCRFMGALLLIDKSAFPPSHALQCRGRELLPCGPGSRRLVFSCWHRWALFTAPSTDPITTTGVHFGSDSAVPTGQTLSAPTAVWQSIPTISPSQATPQPAPTAVWQSIPYAPSSPAPTVVHAMLLSPTPRVVHAIMMPPPPAPDAMWQPVRINTNAITAVAVDTEAMPAFTLAVTSNCGEIKHQIDAPWGLLHSY